LFDIGGTWQVLEANVVGGNNVLISLVLPGNPVAIGIVLVNVESNHTAGYLLDIQVTIYRVGGARSNRYFRREQMGIFGS